MRQHLVATLLLGGIFLTGTIVIASNFSLEASETPSSSAQAAGIEAVELTPFLRAESLEALILIEFPRFLIAVAGVVALVFFLMNAMKYLMNAGNESATGEAKQGMVYAGIGLALVVLAFAAISLIRDLIGA